MFDSVRSHTRQPTRLCRPWDSPGKNTGVGCHFLLQCMKWKVKVKSLSRVWLLVTQRTAAYQAPPSMGFSKQEYWVGCHCLLHTSDCQVCLFLLLSFESRLFSPFSWFPTMYQSSVSLQLLNVTPAEIKDNFIQNYLCQVYLRDSRLLLSCLPQFLDITIISPNTLYLGCLT